MKIDPIGIKEIAQMLGVTNVQVSQYKIHGKLPEPDVELAIGSLWDKEKIVAFINAGGIKDRRRKENNSG